MRGERAARRASARRRARVSFAAVVVGLGVITAGVVAWRFDLLGEPNPPRPSPVARNPFEEPASAEPSPRPDPYPSPTPINDEIEGLTTFRGNETRTYYGQGPVPERAAILWR
jgi:hypothetical protein